MCWRVEINKTSNDEIVSLEDSISHVVDTILAILLEKEIPHNLLISNEGRTIYVIPRKFHQSELVFNTCWNDICGLPTFKEEEKFNNFNENDHIEVLQNNVTISKEDFEEYSKLIRRNLVHYIILKNHNFIEDLAKFFIKIYSKIYIR